LQGLSKRKMAPKVELVKEKKLVGIRQRVCLENYDIGNLWKSFLHKRKEISGCFTDELISMAVYSPSYFENFDPSNEFERWATVEVINFEKIPKDLETFVVPGGLYAVFNHSGRGTDHSVFRYIFQTWLPSSEYVLDNRPHLEILGDSYKNNDPNSEEEIWVPIKIKKV
jgi:AraC family transcriptional regulator